MTKKNPAWYYEIVNIPFTKQEVLCLHAAAILRENDALTRLLRKRIGPVARGMRDKLTAK